MGAGAVNGMAGSRQLFVTQDGFLVTADALRHLLVMAAATEEQRNMMATLISAYQQSNGETEALEEAIRRSMGDGGTGNKRPPAPQDLVDGLHNWHWTQPKSADEQCAICLSAYTKGDLVAQMPCKHLFHKDCLSPWLKQTNSCPFCRQELNATNTKVQTAGRPRTPAADRSAAGSQDARSQYSPHSSNQSPDSSSETPARRHRPFSGVRRGFFLDRQESAPRMQPSATESPVPIAPRRQQSSPAMNRDFLSEIDQVDENSAVGRAAALASRRRSLTGLPRGAAAPQPSQPPPLRSQYSSGSTSRSGDLDLESWSVRKLKTRLSERGIDHSQCLERSELVALYRGGALDIEPVAQSSNVPPRRRPRPSQS